MITATLGDAETSLTAEVTPSAVPADGPGPAAKAGLTSTGAGDGMGTLLAASGLALLPAGGVLLVARRTLTH